MQYRPLDDRKNEIRVLRFLDVSSPVLAEDPLECSIEHVPLEYCPLFQPLQENLQTQAGPVVWDVFTECVDLRDSTLEQTITHEAKNLGTTRNHKQTSGFRYTWGDFEALSYTWGDGDNKRRICVNGNDIDVPTNLENALRALRGLPETRLGMCYWVDSLCINQQDEKEKNKQVKRMKDIYGRARAVVVWLGQEEETDSLAVEIMRFVCRKEMLQPRWYLLSSARYALVAFARKTYWARCCIIQELAMNHNSTLLLCGKFKLTRRMIGLGVLCCQNLLETTDVLDYQPDDDLWQDTQALVNRLYCLLILAFKPDVGIEATIDKDKVYSILGLVDPAISADIIPDYSLSEQQVFTDLTKSVVRESGSLDYIRFGGIPEIKGWPSWVPDWRRPFLLRHVRCYRSFKASGDIPAKFRFEDREESESLLICNGFYVDVVDKAVTETSQIGHFTRSITDSNRYGTLVRQAIHQTMLLECPDVTEELLFEIPWMQNSDEYPASNDPLADQEWLKILQSRYHKFFHKFRENNKNFTIGGQSFQSLFPQSVKRNSDISKISEAVIEAGFCLTKRILITTKTGYLGLAPIMIHAGDVVAILLGSQIPILLRPVGDNRFQFVGECYVHGLMDGEILSDEDVAHQEFVLC
ncbi:hypothetical protein COCCADRAFT_40367 [Bipolaris zeicola 26-R-13]|uniref:Heterokaryon incompatibility domain-containing protein n=1 Tax=Cochliobolus carbonum (strain 26-R-13) TaxID=930089 RepID=W6YDI6_COCC2|nr:uncharacterized protein COCCADRAFT_40367 [Bipolaris zeicola 26-R-13]EUC29241.1 hypothetical protein COCCADRAFT_40367 [Bipolaris zeicola 26-R-13]